VITCFATAYYLIGRFVGPPLSPISAWVFSMTSFHGRGFFPGGIVNGQLFWLIPNLSEPI